MDLGGDELVPAWRCARPACAGLYWLGGGLVESARKSSPQSSESNETNVMITLA